MYISAKVDYATRVLLMLAASNGVPLAEVHGLRPDQRSYEGPAEHLQDVWVALRAAMRDVLETVTLDTVLSGKLPPRVAKLVADPDAWEPRPLR